VAHDDLSRLTYVNNSYFHYFARTEIHNELQNNNHGIDVKFAPPVEG